MNETHSTAESKSYPSIVKTFNLPEKEMRR